MQYLPAVSFCRLVILAAAQCLCATPLCVKLQSMGQFNSTDSSTTHLGIRNVVKMYTADMCVRSFALMSIGRSGSHEGTLLTS